MQAALTAALAADQDLAGFVANGYQPPAFLGPIPLNAAADGQRAWNTLQNVVPNLAGRGDQIERIRNHHDVMALGGHAQQIANQFVDREATRAGGITDVAAANADALWARDEGDDLGTELTDAERRGFAAALRRLPAIRSLEQMLRRGGPDLGAEPIPDRAVWGQGGMRLVPGPHPNGRLWQGGGWLVDGLVVSENDVNGQPVPRRRQLRRPIDDGTVRRRVLGADRILRTLMSTQVSASIRKPALIVHALPERRFRAFQDGNAVHFAADDTRAIIVHELGHYIETTGELGSWVDIQKLLLTRHHGAGGGATVGRGPTGMRSEGRLAGSYPATGRYTSKAYDDGATEVMSMTVEHLADRRQLGRMLDRDPLQAAIVLRALDPTSYAGLADLRPFDRFLPSV